LQSEPTAHDRDTLMRYLDPDATLAREAVTSILPLDELHERLDLIETIEGLLEQMSPSTWVPSAIHFATLLVALLGRIRQTLTWRSREGDRVT
jgi:hypothetical protein